MSLKKRERDGDGEETPPPPPAKKLKQCFSDTLQKVELSLWKEDGTVDIKRCEDVKHAGLKMLALHWHMKTIPTDFPSKYLPILRDWVKDIRLLNHYFSDDEMERETTKQAFIKVRLRNGHVLTIYTDMSGGIAINRLSLRDEHKEIRYEIMRFHDELEYGDEARWTELVRGELPEDDVDCPGASFMLRFFCFLGFQEAAYYNDEDDRYRPFSCIDDALGIDYGVSNRQNVYQRYPFFREYWRYLEHQVVSVLGGPTKVHPLLPVLTRIVLSYALCPPDLTDLKSKPKKKQK